MNSAGVTPQSLIQKWQFAVEMAGFDAAYFEKSDFPEFEFDEVAFNPAGSIFPQKAAGRAKFSDIAMSKGIPQETADTSLISWMRQCIAVAAGSGGVPSDYMRDIDIVKYSRDEQEVKRYRLFGAWCKRGSFGDGEGGTSDNDIEEMTLAYQYFEEL